MSELKVTSSSDKTAKLRRPKKLICYSFGPDNDTLQYGDDNIRHFHFKKIKVFQYDLSEGYNPELILSGIGAPKSGLRNMLAALMRYEKSNNCKTEAQVVAQRLCATKLFVIPYYVEYNYIFDYSVDLDIQVFDGQVFIEPAKKMLGNKASLSEDLQKFMYYGLKYRAVATLPKHYDECSADELTENENLSVDQLVDTKSLMLTGVGDVSMIIGTDVDCVDDNRSRGLSDSYYDGLSYFAHSDRYEVASDPKQSQIVEMKSMRVAGKFKYPTSYNRKLFLSWAQCSIVGIQNLYLGFWEDGGLMTNLHYKIVGKLPHEAQKTEDWHRKRTNTPEGPIPNPNYLAWDPEKCINWYNHVFEWMIETVLTKEKENPDLEKQVWRLSYTMGEDALKLSKMEDYPEIITREFREWRQSLRNRDGSA